MPAEVLSRHTHQNVALGIGNDFSRIQGLTEVGDDVSRVFNADGEAHEFRADPGGGELLIRELAVLVAVTSVALGLLICGQVALGISNVVYSLPLWVATAHTAGAAALLFVIVGLLARLSGRGVRICVDSEMLDVEHLAKICPFLVKWNQLEFEALLARPIALASRVPGGVLPEFVQDANVTASGQMAIEDGALTYRPDPCLLYTSPSPRDRTRSRMPSSA